MKQTTLASAAFYLLLPMALVFYNRVGAIWRGRKKEANERANKSTLVRLSLSVKRAERKRHAEKVPV